MIAVVGVQSSDEVVEAVVVQLPFSDEEIYPADENCQPRSMVEISEGHYLWIYFHVGR